MRKTFKKQLTNIVFIVFLVLFLFTPLKFHLSVYISKLIALTPFAIPSTIENKEQVLLESYRWELIDENGSPFNLEKEKGNVICINFWATWCPPCVAEMSGFQKLYDSYGDKVAFLFVANDEVDKVNAFMQKKGYTLPVYYARSKAPKTLKYSSIPTTYLIDGCGRIVIKETRVANWYSKEMITILDEMIAEQKLKNLLGENSL